jgi:chemotaxis signal transduction protein
MGLETRFLILSLEKDRYAIPVERVLEITVPRDVQKNANLTQLFEGTVEFRGKRIPIVDLKKVFKLPGKSGSILLIVTSEKGTVGMLVDEVSEIFDSSQKLVPIPEAVMNPTRPYYRGILRHKGQLVLLLNEDGLL